MVYGLTPYIHEYFTREYFNTTVPSNCEFKNTKNAKIANPQNINPAKIKAHTVSYRDKTFDMQSMQAFKSRKANHFFLIY